MMLFQGVHVSDADTIQIKLQRGERDVAVVEMQYDELEERIRVFVNGRQRDDVSTK